MDTFLVMIWPALGLKNTLGPKQGPLFHFKNNEVLWDGITPDVNEIMISQSYLSIKQRSFFATSIPWPTLWECEKAASVSTKTSPIIYQILQQIVNCLQYVLSSKLKFI